MKTSSEEAKKRTLMLLELRKQHEATVQKAQEYLKIQQSARKKLRKALETGPLSVPGLAAATSMPSHEVLWHIAAMKKYGLVEEAGMDDAKDYYLYIPVKEQKS